MERILHIPGCEAMNRMNGIANFIMNVYRNIDRDKYQFDFIVYGKQAGEYDTEIQNLGGRIFHVVSPGSNPIKNAMQTYRIMQQNAYGVMHRHTASSLCAVDFVVARLAGVKVRISHSHGNYCTKEKLHHLLYPVFIRNVTHRMACGAEAGKWLYGDKREFSVQKNGIDSAKFTFDQMKRMAHRKDLGIADHDCLIGMIGRVSPQKNPLFLLEIFNQIIREYQNFRLIYVGDGPLMAELKCRAKELGIQKYIMFPGVSNDVPKWLSALDIVVYTSLYEGFPIAVLESEASGLPSVISDKVPAEVDVTGLTRQIALDEGVKVWASAVVKQAGIGKRIDRSQYSKKVADAGYDIKNTAKELMAFYNKACLL